MKSIILSGTNIKQQLDFIDDPSVGVFKLDEKFIGCGLMELEMPEFNNQSSNFGDSVFVEKIAFSCNFRDRSLVNTISDAVNKEEEQSPDNFLFSCIGSEFVARVIAVGENVENIKVGDRVIPNGNYPFSDFKDVLPGIPTNEASSRYQVFNKHKLMKISSSMSDEVAACFSIGAQTASGIIRRLPINRDSRILITAGSSNTSLFLINMLKTHENLFVLSSSKSAREKLQKMGILNIIEVDYNKESFELNTKEKKYLFDIIIDPFIDTYFTRLSAYLAMNGTYITCGIFNQYRIPENLNHLSNFKILQSYAQIIQNNLTLIGNCLGTTNDLVKAIKLHEEGKLDVIIDSVYKGNDVSSFFEKTFCSTERFGKVVYKYSDF